MLNLVPTRTSKILFCRAAAPLCTSVEVYSSLDFGLCNTSQKNREKTTFRAMLTQMYIAMHPWAPHTVLFHAKKATANIYIRLSQSYCQFWSQCAKWTHYVSISSAWEHVRTFTKVCAELCRPVSWNTVLSYLSVDIPDSVGSMYKTRSLFDEF